RSAAEIEAFLRDYVLDLVASMEHRGYDVEKGGEFGSAQIGADGQLVKSGSGTHRFCVARLLGLTRFPLRVVGIHAGWAAGVEGGLTVAELGKRLKEIGERYR
ncbi:MAG TPA: hypothetical protein VLA52_12475, partial [Thermohalobaculum sp.]|nr:hypothetical protein [Thermohalobaculum sp.]